jgi:undecaprenyl-diphosphatase
VTTTGSRRSWTSTRSRRDVGSAVGALVVLLLAAWAASGQRVPGWERSVFAAVNDRSVLPFVAVWPVMQLGNVAVVWLTALAAAITRRFRLATGLLGGGLLAYLLAKVVKAAVGRPRPFELLEEVAVRGPHVSDNGFVSGHATVAAVVAAVLLPHVGRRSARALIGLAVLVSLSRVHVGAHLPLDVVGGMALGVAVAAGVHVALGRPPGRRTSRRLSAPVA